MDYIYIPTIEYNRGLLSAFGTMSTEEQETTATSLSRSVLKRESSSSVVRCHDHTTTKILKCNIVVEGT